MSDEIGVEDPRTDDVAAVLTGHLRWAIAQSPAEAVHALDLTGLLDPALTLYGLRRDGQLLATGALKLLGDRHAELKSMHVVAAARGQGLGRLMLDHLLEVAVARGVERVSLETGSTEVFQPALALYASAGFEPCGPFGDYPEHDFSVFMTRRVAPI